MTTTQLKKEVLEANLALVEHGLVMFTWGNVSAVDRVNNIVAIKPSGVSYDELRVQDIVVLDMDGNKLEGDLNPSSDTTTHIELYKAFDNVSGVVHTHSTYATIYAQAGCPLDCFGTTHADYFYGTIPCTRAMKKHEIESNYEQQTGTLIVETFKKIDPNLIPGVLVFNHGPFTWGKDAYEAVHNAAVLEQVAKIALGVMQLSPDAKSISRELLDKHFFRKHGTNAYYGQDD